MAYAAASLQTLNVGANAIHIYNSTDSLAAANYFDAAAAQLKVGDHILQSTGTLAVHYVVLTNSGTAVTVATIA